MIECSKLRGTEDVRTRLRISNFPGIGPRNEDSSFRTSVWGLEIRTHGTQSLDLGYAIRCIRVLALQTSDFNSLWFRV